MRPGYANWPVKMAIAFVWVLSCHNWNAMGQAARPSGEPGIFRFTERASVIDSRCRSHLEIGFLLNDEKGNPADLQQASVDTSVAPKGRLVIWMMGYYSEFFDRWNRYGLHAIRVHYVNRWFSICCQEKPVDENCRGDIRLEAATGIDFSDNAEIPYPDGMMERSFQFVRWLDHQHPQGNWDQFLSARGEGLNWEKVIISGSSHGATTSARFAKYQKVARVVALCGPRDQFQVWQSLTSATPDNRFFAFSHVLDRGWVEDHYCRSWEMMGLHKFGEIVNVDQSSPPFQNSRRLITSVDVNRDAKRAHGCVQPGKRAVKDPETGNYVHENVWKYLYTHPVDVVGKTSQQDPGCLKEQIQK
ncbi:MAG: hypothetical protein AAF939_06115 [Planctomycetota bacterium]